MNWTVSNPHLPRWIQKLVSVPQFLLTHVMDLPLVSHVHSVLSLIS